MYSTPKSQVAYAADGYPREVLFDKYPLSQNRDNEHLRELHYANHAFTLQWTIREVDAGESCRCVVEIECRRDFTSSLILWFNFYENKK